MLKEASWPVKLIIVSEIIQQCVLLNDLHYRKTRKFQNCPLTFPVLPPPPAIFF